MSVEHVHTRILGVRLGGRAKERKTGGPLRLGIYLGYFLTRPGGLATKKGLRV